jgi:hypothetical protein
MNEDPIVAEVRRVREQLAAKFNYDIHAIVEDLRKRQVSLGARLVRRKLEPATDLTSELKKKT